MKNIKFLFLLAFIALASCSSKTTSPKKTLILVSIAPYQFLTERIAGEDFTIQTVVPTGADPHSYEPTASKLSSLGQGAVWFCIGEPFENKILPVLKKQNPLLRTSDLRDSCPLIHTSLCCPHCCANQEDRHIWLSPKAAISQVRQITLVLSEQFPKDREKFLENGNLLIKELTDLDLELREILAHAKYRTFLVSHPAFAYFCKDYHLTQLSVEQDGKEPRPKYLEQILEKAIASNTKLGLCLPQHSNKGLELMAHKLQLSVRSIDPYSYNYFETLRELSHTIAETK